MARGSLTPNWQQRRALRWRRALALALVPLLALGSLLGAVRPVAAVSATLVISQFQVAGGTAADEFIELHNVSNANIDLNGYRVVYRSVAGTSDITIVAWSSSTTLAAGGYYLIAASPGYDDSPAPDLTYNHSGTGLLAAASGGLAIRNGAADTGTIVDSVGYGSASNGFTEGSNAGSSGSSRQRKPSPNTSAVGCLDTDNNLNDFEAPSPVTPRNRLTPAAPCYGSGVALAASGSASPAAVSPGGNTLLTVNVTLATNPGSSGVAVTGDLTAIGGGASQTFYDDGTNGGDATAGDNIFSYTATVAPGTSSGAKTLPIAIADAELRTASTSISLSVLGARTKIHTIQGAAHLSPLTGQLLTNIQGIVTAKTASGFYLQERDADADADPATSEAIFVFTSSAPTVSVGDAVIVGGTVVEFRPGGSGGTNNLTLTEITNPGRSVAVISSGNALPAPIVLGTGGRIPPATVIEDDATGDVEASGVTFDPANDGMDFYESLEGMRVRVNDAVAVGPTNDFGEIPVVGDNGANAGVRTARGGVVIQAADFNPERLILDDTIIGAASMPKVSVGTTFPGATLGVLDYSFGNFKLNVTALPTANTSGAVTKETTPLTVGANQFTVATFNVENLQPNNAQAKFDALAAIIVTNLRAPDIIALEEVQDNNGATNDSVVDASATYAKLIAAIQATGGNTGPTYQFRQIDPVDDQDGGEPGGNIRVGFLFRTDRGIGFVDRAAPGSCASLATCAVGVETGASGAQLTFSPGRIDPTNTAFNTSRKPLAGEFTFNGQKVFVVANHFNSKGGDQPLFGRYQPPTRSSETQRAQQATVLRGFVDDLLAADANANIVLLGDFNDFQFSNALGILKGSGATAMQVLLETLPANEQYSYVFDGNSQALDHIIVSPHLDGLRSGYDVVHVNAEFSPQDSDHDPQLARFTLPPPAPTASPVAKTVIEDTPTAITLQGTAGGGGSLTYTIVGNPSHGTLGTVSGAQVTYTPASNYNGPDSFTYKVTENGVDSNVATVSITVSTVNDPPIANLGNKTTDEDTQTTITLGATDAEGDTLTYTIVSGPTHGTLALLSGNQYTYTPNANYSGTDSFTFKANDGTSDSNTATVTITINAVNDPPVASNGTATTGANIGVTITLAASDVEGSTLTYTIVTQPAHGTLGTINGASVTYTPAAGYSGGDSFTFKANDGSADSNTATISITVQSAPTPTFTLSISATSGGSASPASGSYTAGSAVSLAATANGGSSFVGWTIDGGFAGFKNPLPITMNANHTVIATFAPTPSFGDVNGGTPYADAIRTLAAYGAIRGYGSDYCQARNLGNSCFGPADKVSRAQMAALIVRAMGWSGDQHLNPFTDRGGIADELWRSVGTLAHYKVAYGYGDGRFGPNDNVTYLQAISFITRAMVVKGYWTRAQADDPTVYPNVPANSPHRADLITFVKYAGALPGFDGGTPYAAWNGPATRGWYAAALYQALNSRFATTP